MIGMAFGLGFILGPAIGGVLADNSVVSWFNPSTPFLFTTLLTLVNIVLLIFLFPETLKEKGSRAVSMFTGVKNIVYSFRMPNLRSIFSVALLFSLGFTFFTQFFAVALIEKFDYTEKDIGLFYAWVGIWLVFTQGFLVRILAKKNYQPANLLKVTMLTLSIGLLLVLFPSDVYWEYFIAPIIAISHGIVTPNLLSAISAQASPSQQGSILGINQSMQSLGATLPPIIGGYLTAINFHFPLVASAAIVFIAWVVFLMTASKLKD